MRGALEDLGSVVEGEAEAGLVGDVCRRAEGGQVVLRIDDTDLDRSTKENEAGIRTTWLG